MTITFVSVVVAIVVGLIETLGLIGDQLNLGGPFWHAIGALNDNFGMLGYVIVGIFILSWLVSVAVYRMKGYGQLDVGEPAPGCAPLSGPVRQSAGPT
jgi:nickel/cobalt transporter (NiCoT) family protein